MGKLVMAAKITHVPSIWLSIQPGKYFGIRRGAELGLIEVGRRARERGADTFVIHDTHWLNSMGFHVNGKARHQGGDCPRASAAEYRLRATQRRCPG